MTAGPLGVLVAGAGQAGLAIGHRLRGTGPAVELLEGAPRVGDGRRSRRDSLRLFIAAEYCSLPGLGRAPEARHPGPPAGGGCRRVARCGRRTVRPRRRTWCCGPRATGRTWVDVPGAVVDGRPVHRRGLSPVPGLAWLGLPWQRTRGSALLRFVGADAASLARRLTTAA